ncbi:cytochrome c oxidase subunit II transmembrane domain-containing protein [Coxiella endosymbiont of Ornithodoros amblus]|uniref:cytochrome c oxidase subunit II transmembrane domain-containing protein n=1 Tax=Coxiella endosymbiont of Ornithodoros amblus TaxID=1656166 RepID=UPI00244DB904|nr:cytochrome c oxidase subunit II transmembrane domain-containing protein [Coxiella endosymbiont of Ornithodoros amblus]
MLSLSRGIFELHMIIFYIFIAVSILTFGAMISILYKFRKSRRAVPANFHERISVEIFWTVIPFIILVIMVFPATMILYQKHNNVTQVKK